MRLCFYLAGLRFNNRDQLSDSGGSHGKEELVIFTVVVAAGCLVLPIGFFACGWYLGRECLRCDYRAALKTREPAAANRVEQRPSDPWVVDDYGTETLSIDRR
jgi:hypothetical protein